MIIYLDQKMTANEVAKIMVAAYGLNNPWLDSGECYAISMDKLTQKERDDIEIACIKQCERLKKALGVDQLVDKYGIYP